MIIFSSDIYHFPLSDRQFKQKEFLDRHFFFRFELFSFSLSVEQISSFHLLLERKKDLNNVEDVESQTSSQVSLFVPITFYPLVLDFKQNSSQSDPLSFRKKAANFKSSSQSSLFSFGPAVGFKHLIHFTFRRTTDRK